MSPAMRAFLGGVELRGLTAAQRAAVVEVLEMYDVRSPEARQLIAYVTDRPDLAPSETDWQQARERREPADVFMQLADLLEQQAGGISREGLGRLRRGLRAASERDNPPDEGS